MSARANFSGDDSMVTLLVIHISMSQYLVTTGAVDIWMHQMGVSGPATNVLLLNEFFCVSTSTFLWGTTVWLLGPAKTMTVDIWRHNVLANGDGCTVMCWYG